jgi:hypothetical protein
MGPNKEIIHSWPESHAFENISFQNKPKALDNPQYRICSEQEVKLFVLTIALDSYMDIGDKKIYYQLYRNTLPDLALE